jgi:hypothetical protein
MKWRLFPVVVDRKEDLTTWTPAGDTPFPVYGFNFVAVRKAWIGWWLDYSDRWVFYNADLFRLRKRL